MVRSNMERRLMMASTPIIRYYDHSPLVREVQMRVQELRRSTQSGEEDNRRKQQNTTPGESKQAPAHKNGSSPADAPELSARPAAKPILDNPDFQEASLTFHEQSSTPAATTRCQGPESAHSGGSEKEVRERSTKWTA
jgi:hypothetical protein